MRIVNSLFEAIDWLYVTRGRPGGDLRVLFGYSGGCTAKKEVMYQLAYTLKNKRGLWKRFEAENFSRWLQSRESKLSGGK